MPSVMKGATGRLLKSVYFTESVDSWVWLLNRLKARASTTSPVRSESLKR